MRKLITLVIIHVLSCIAANSALAAEWLTVPGETSFEYEGQIRQTACARDAEDESSFAFYVRKGDPERLAIFFDGGGACWDPNTCFLSPTFDDTVDSVDDLNNAAGLARLDRPDNPIRSYTQVFIPYCTGDLHVGENVQEYSSAEFGIPPSTIRHLGANNVAFVLKWIREYYQDEVGHAPRRVFLSGASAGGYGVLYHTPAIADMLPWYTRVRVLVDAANGVITQDFYDRTLAPGGVWNVQANLPPVLQSAFASGPDTLTVETFKSLAYAYPYARFGQYTTAFDATQIFFYNVARNTDDPFAWLNEDELVIAGFEWAIKARTAMILTALQTWNYRYYVAAGGDHTAIASDKFYTEDSAGGVRLADWLDDMINRRWLWWGNDWRNVSCTPNCFIAE